MKCKCGEFECPYVEDTNGQCCIPEKCPEYQSYEMIGDAYYEFTKKEYLNWSEVERKIGEAYAKIVGDMKDPPKGKICYLDYVYQIVYNRV